MNLAYYGDCFPLNSLRFAVTLPSARIEKSSEYERKVALF